MSLLRRCGVFLREHALPSEECVEILSAFRHSPGEAAKVYSRDADEVIDERTRRALSVTPPVEMGARIESVLDGLRPELERHFSTPLSEREPPHYLLYRSGDFFAAHRDRPRAIGTEISSRRISGVLFLNDDFTGGDLRFFGLIDGDAWATVGFSCPAAPGLFVAFRADTLHEVAPVTAGIRATVATWFA